MSLRAFLFCLVLPAVLAGCAKPPLASVSRIERDAIAVRLNQDIAILASDAFGGRKPGTPGGRATVDFLSQRFAQVGLESGTNDPGNPWRAPVGLTQIHGMDSQVDLIVDGRTIAFSKQEAVAVTTLQRILIAEADMIFVGYEAESVPAEQVAGKVVVMLADKSLNPERRILLEAKQANGVIVVPQLSDEWDRQIVSRIRQDARREKIALSSDVDEIFAAVATQGAMARALGAHNWQSLVDAAGKTGFAPIDLNAKANIEAKAQRREFESHNIIGRIAGRNPDKGAVLLLAHWDHLGECGPPEAADRLCNGAVDNASGVALMLELVRRLAQAGSYERDIYVLATSAEEVGLLGARAFAANPAIALDKVVAAFNFDTVAVAPEGSPLGFIGEGRTPLDPLVLEVLAQTGRELGNRDYAKRFLQRQDAWVLLDKGVPALLLSSAFASETTTGPYFESAYHTTSDDAEGIELGGAIDDLLLHEELVKRLAVPVPDAP